MIIYESPRGLIPRVLDCHGHIEKRLVNQRMEIWHIHVRVMTSTIQHEKHDTDTLLDIWTNLCVDLETRTGRLLNNLRLGSSRD